MELISKHQGDNRHIGEMKGMQVVVMPRKTIETIEEAVMMNEDLVDGKAVQDLFHISKKTLSNDVWSGKIPKEDYTIAFNGQKFFWLKKLLRIKPKSYQMELPIP